MKYRKRPIVVEAWQYPGGSIDNSWPEWVREKYADSTIRETGASWGDLSIVTLEGNLILRPLSWIIKGVNGEIYPCDPDVFEKTYEEWDDDGF